MRNYSGPASKRTIYTKVRSLIFIKTVGVSIISLFFIFCNNGSISEKSIDILIAKDSLKRPLDANVYYFPENKGDSNINGVDKFVNQWYSKMLFALQEPILFTDTDSSEIFRFTWLRTFHKPISIRISKQAENYALILKIVDGAGGYEPGKLVKDTVFFITKNDWKNFSLKIEQVVFWKLKSISNNDDGKDGSEWILEGKVKDKYHVVSRWTPSEKRFRDFKKCCDYLIKISGISIPAKEAY